MFAVFTDVGWLAEELEIDAERESIAGHDDIVGKETAACSYLSHIAIRVS